MTGAGVADGPSGGCTRSEPQAACGGAHGVELYETDAPCHWIRTSDQTGEQPQSQAGAANERSRFRCCGELAEAVSTDT